MKIRWNWRPRERIKRDKWRSNWRTVEIHNVGNGKEIFFIEKGLLVFEVQNPDVEQYTKVAAAIQSIIQCFRVIYDEEKKKRATTQTSLDFFFQEGVHVFILSYQSCLNFCNFIDCSPPGSSVHGILQARILEWVAMPSSRGSSWPRNWTHISSLLHWQVSSLPLAPPGKPSFKRVTSVQFNSVAQLCPTLWPHDS